MRQILVYGDSLTWGIIPHTRLRLAFAARWPGVLEGELTASGQNVRVIEDCLNGRRTVWDDPYKPGRNGLATLEQRVESASPLALVILALGTNDFQFVHDNDAWHSGEGISALVQAVRRAPVEPGMPVPLVLVMAPPPFDNPRGVIASKFRDAERKCAGLAAAYKAVAEHEHCAFFDVASVTTSSKVDGVHLDAEQHVLVGQALVPIVQDLLAQVD